MSATRARSASAAAAPVPPQALVPFGTKAFVFHENPDENADAVDVFREIARITGGVYLPFDRNSAGELAGLLAAIGAYAAGGVTALERHGGAAARLLLQHLK